MVVVVVVVDGFDVVVLVDGDVTNGVAVDDFDLANCDPDDKSLGKVCR